MRIRDVFLYAVLTISIGLLEFYFSWTSHLLIILLTGKNGLTMPTVVFYFLDRQLHHLGLYSYFISYGQEYCLSSLTGYAGCSALYIAMRALADIETVLSTIVVFVSAFFIYRKQGHWRSFLFSLLLTSAAVIPLGIEVYVFDRSEFYDPSALVLQNNLSWVTNAAVLYVSIVLFLASFFLLKLSFFRRHFVRHRGGLTSLRRPSPPASSEGSHRIVVNRNRGQTPALDLANPLNDAVTQ